MLRFEGLDGLNAMASRSSASDPMVPSYLGGRFPLSTYIAGRVRAMLADPASWGHLPPQVRDWLSVQRWKSRLPRQRRCWSKPFRGAAGIISCAILRGAVAHQTLGMLVTRRLERMGVQPMGFAASDYALSVWAVRDLSLMIGTGRLSLQELFDQDMLGDDLEAWLEESHLMKRTFRNVAIIAGLIERRRRDKRRPAGRPPCLLRSHRRAEEPRVRPYSAQGGVRRRGNRAHRSRPAGAAPGADSRAHHPPARCGVAAGGR